MQKKPQCYDNDRFKFKKSPQKEDAKVCGTKRSYEMTRKPSIPLQPSDDDQQPRKILQAGNPESKPLKLQKSDNSSPIKVVHKQLSI